MFTDDLLVALAEVLDAAGAGTWSPSGAYASDAHFGIVFGELAPTPDLQLGLSTYALNNEPGQSDELLGIQLVATSAGTDPGPVMAAIDAAFEALNGLGNLDFSTGAVLLMWRNNGVDVSTSRQTGRLEKVENYWARVDHPTARTE